MKKFKFLAFAIVIILLSISIYQGFIYYRIPFNPFKEYASESPVDFHLTKNLADGKGVTAASHDANTSSLIMEYLSDLKLMPLKDKTAYDIFSKIEDRTHLTGMIKFNESEIIFLSDLFTADPTVLHISSPNSSKNGYYKIVDSEFDYNYIYNLISETEE